MKKCREILRKCRKNETFIGGIYPLNLRGSSDLPKIPTIQNGFLFLTKDCRAVCFSYSNLSEASEKNPHGLGLLQNPRERRKRFGLRGMMYN